MNFLIETVETLLDDTAAAAGQAETLRALDHALRSLARAADIGATPATDKRIAWLAANLPAGAVLSDEQFKQLVETRRINAKGESILISQHRYEGLSRGRGWCRHGKGSDAIWGEREGSSYRVSACGTWTVYGSDGFSREGRETWEVARVEIRDASGAIVGSWLVAD